MVLNYVPGFPRPMTIMTFSHSSKHPPGIMNIYRCRTTMMHENPDGLFQPISLNTAKAPSVSFQGFLLVVSA